MDGGIGEMALMDALIGGAETGAVIGGGKSLLTGEDPIRGALMGGLMGGATGGLLNGIMPGATAAVPGAEAASTPVISSGAVTPTSFANAPMDMTAYAPTPTQFGAFGEAPSSIGSTMGSGPSFDASAYTGAPPTGTASVADAAQRAASQNFGTSQIPGMQTPPVGSTNPAMKWWDSLTDKQKLMTGGAGVLGVGMLADRNKYGVPEQAPYTGPLSRFKYNPDTYKPSFYAEGGIASLNSGGYDRVVGEDPYQQNFAAGGVTGGGNIDLHIPVDIGGGGGGGGYSSSSGGGYSVFNGDNNSGTGQPATTGGLNVGGMGGNTPDIFQPQPQVFPTQPLQHAPNDEFFTARKQPPQYMRVTTPDIFNPVFPTQQQYAMGGMAYADGGGIANLGSYSDGGRMLKGPGDGMSDSIPATIAGKQPARLANDEFVVPADVVSHLGNGSSDAGAKQLYAMMNRVRKARTGNPKQGREIKAGKYMPA